MASHSSTLAWKIPWSEEPGRLQSMRSLGVGHNWANSLSLSHIGEGNGNPLQYSCLENPRDRGAWWAAVYGVAQSRTRLKRLSSSSSRTSPQMTHTQQWESESTSSKFRNKTGFPFSPLYSTRIGSPNHSKQIRNKNNPNWKESSKTVTVCRWHDPIHRKC